MENVDFLILSVSSLVGKVNNFIDEEYQKVKFKKEPKVNHKLQ